MRNLRLVFKILVRDCLHEISHVAIMAFWILFLPLIRVWSRAEGGLFFGACWDH